MNKTGTGPGPTGLEVAVIGMAGRFPGAGNVREFWDNLKNSVEAISFLGDRQLEKAGIAPEVLENPEFVKSAGGVLEDSDMFDASFFDYTPREAEVMDPQMRIFHECAWEALEDAGYDPLVYKGKIGVYAGATLSLYWAGLTLLVGGGEDFGSFLINQLVNKDFISTRVSYKLGLNGPSISTQTACSTSLVTIHQACRALLGGECKMALAGGVTISTAAKQGYFYEEGMILSPDGHCRAFDAEARGVVSGEGIGLAVLKTLKNAYADGDHIYAIIKGSSINNDGSRKVGYTAPSVEGQADVIRVAQRIAHVEPESIGCVETHGTATSLGDPVEIEALKIAFDTKKTGFCAIGSIKTNMGHLDSAAGIAGFIKAVLALKYRQIPPSLNFKNPNPKLQLENSPFYVNTTLKKWENDTYPLRAGVSSFGIGGTNAHVVLEQPPPMEPPGESRPHQLVLLSAKTPSALNRAAARLWEFLTRNPGINLADAAYTLKVGRRAFDFRRMILAAHNKEAAEILSQQQSGTLHLSRVARENPPVVFMFSGQGSQYVRMGSQLYRQENLFREEMDRCFQVLKPLTGYDFKKILYPHDGMNGQTSPGVKNGLPGINQTEIAQPLLFAFEYSLAALMMKWGIHPYAMIGHSIGEYVAACLSSVLSLEDALRLVAVRGKLMQKMPPGDMLSVSLPEKELVPLLNDDLSLAAVNGPALCVVSGSHEAIKYFSMRLKEKEVDYKQLHTSHAFHSKMMEPMLKEFEEVVRSLHVSEPKIPYISNVTGNWQTFDDAANPTYWSTHVRKTVKFSAGIGQLLKEENSIFMEIGPGKALTTFVKQHLTGNSGHFTLNLVRHPKEEISDAYFLARKLGQLWLYGKTIDWRAFYAGEKRRRVSLPAYSFDRQRFRTEAHLFKIVRAGNWGSPLTLNKKADMTHWFYVPSWERTILLLPRQAQAPPRPESCWLVFVDECGLGRQLVKKLEQQKQKVISVKMKTGNSFRQAAHNKYEIDPQENRAYDILFKKLREAKIAPGKILHLWGVRENKINRENFSRTQQLGLYSVIDIVRAMANLEYKNETRLGIITNHVHDVTGQEEVLPAKATVLAAVKTVPQEYPNIRCINIDIHLDDTRGPKGGKLVRCLLGELDSTSPDTIAAYRGYHRWVRTYKPLPLAEPELSGTGLPLRKQGVYVITGGLGNVGLALAAYMAQQAKARLVLIGRSVFPAKEEWNEWLAAHHRQDTISLKIRRIQQLEALGASVLVVNADAADEAQMRKAFALAETQFGGIHGVIHAAGVLGEASWKTINKITEHQCELQFQPKIHGLLVLEKLLADIAPDFCMLTSSIASVLGGLGFTAYSAANIFMDAFAQQHNKVSPFTWISVNWDGWQFPAAGGQPAREEDQGITPAEGGRAFQRILSYHDIHQVVISTTDLPTRIDRWLKPGPVQEKEDTPADSAIFYSRPNLSTTYTAPGTELEKKVTQIWQTFFGIEPVGVHDDFFELGGDSLSAIRLARKLNKAGINVTVDDMYLYHTISKICNDRLQKKEEPQQYKAIEGFIRENYENDLEYRVYQLPQAAYNVLFVLNNRIDIHGLLEHFKNKFAPGYYPHYVKLVESPAGILKTKDPDNESFSKAMRLQDRITGEEKRAILTALEKNRQLSASLKKNKIVNQYTVSPIQGSFLAESGGYKTLATNNIYVSYNFTSPETVETVKSRVAKLPDVNGLLRAIIKETDTGPNIIQLDSPANIEIPFIDASHLSLDCRKKIQNTIDEELRKPFEVIDNILYRLVLLKLDNCNYKLFFAFNHLIFDADSVLILEDQIQTMSKGPGAVEKKTGGAKTYYDYTKFMNALSYEDIEIEKYLNLPDYLQSAQGALKESTDKNIKEELFEIDLHVINRDLKDYYNEILLLCYAEVIRHVYRVDNVPVLFISNGRNYKDGNFSNIIGDFHDSIPVLFHRHPHRDIKSILQDFIAYREYIKNMNLNFMNLIVKEYAAGKDYSGIFSSPFTFNPQIGLYELYRIKYNEKSNPAPVEEELQPGSRQMRFQLTMSKDFHSDKLMISLLHNSNYESNALKSLFMECYLELVHELNI